MERALCIGALALSLAACSDDGLLDQSYESESSSEAEDTWVPARYSPGEVHSPITPYVAESLWNIAWEGDWKDDVFAKVGASSTVSHSTLHCFASDDWDLGEHTDLIETLDFFLAGDAAGSTPFDRETEAALSGYSAGWAIDGDPSPLEQEIEAIGPRYAIIHYGTNDMGLGSTYGSAMLGYYENMVSMMDQLIEVGIIPVLTGISPRMDSANANLWVASYNALIRGMAEAQQVPFIDLYTATQDLEGQGMGSDGLHLNGYSGGSCVLTEEGLEHGYNMRNLIVLEALDRLRWTVVEEVDGLDPLTSPLQGDGRFDDPWVVDRLPFTHRSDTSLADSYELDQYWGCDSDSDESGPELIYELELEQETAIRALVLDRGDVDIDLHILGASGTEEDCWERGHNLIETTLPAGTWLISMDSWVDGEGISREGQYQLVLLECDPGDSDCD